MTARSGMQTVLVAVLAAVLVAGAAAVQAAREQRYPPTLITDDGLYITSGAVLRRLSVGYQALAADLYWIRAIQYFGGIRLKLADPSGTLDRGEALPTSYDQLYPLLDLTTSLDPHFNIAYRFGSIFLAEPFPTGAGRPDQAIALLEKGLQERPDRWQYLQDIGFVHYWWRQDYTTAADWFRRAGEVPGAPWWLQSLAAVTLAEGGDRRSSRLMWQAILESAEIDWLRRDAERRLLQLQALDDIDALQTLVDRITTATGRSPESWAAVARSSTLGGVPADPAGTPYVLSSDGRVSVSPSSPLSPLLVEPKRAVPLS